MKNISIVIPVFNAENTIERVLASLISNKDFIKEVILVNDRSYDDTFSKIEKFKTFFDIQIIDNQGEEGPGPARKTGLLAATGEWITFVDADDCLTANSLYYVSRYLENENMVLLHTKTIYYESGEFIAQNVAYSNLSCGGNFYDRQFLIDNHLLPHDTLYMAEDEYFNDIVRTFITHDTDKKIMYFDYPVYEVHHDNDIKISFAHSHWDAYLGKYHIIYKQYVLDFFKDKPHIIKAIKKDVQNHLIFAYYVIQGMLINKTAFLDKNILSYYYDSLKYYYELYGETELSIINYYNDNSSNNRNIYHSAAISMGYDFRIKIPFEVFIKSIIKQYGPLA